MATTSSGSSSTPAPTAASTPTTTVNQKRGGKHIRAGFYQGGSVLNDSYELKFKNSYHSSTQLREERFLSDLEKSLVASKQSISVRRFKGYLGIDRPTDEMNKDEFVQEIRASVRKFGLESFFCLPDRSGKMKFLVTSSHLFTLEDVLDEHASRLEDEPQAIVDANGTETRDSVLARFKKYDDFERCDLSLSRLVVENLVGPELRQKIFNRFDHREDFDYLPGQVYFMMVLDVTHASVHVDLEDARTNLRDIELLSYPGENVADFADACLRYWKVLIMGFYVEYTWGSQLAQKLTNTSSALFNTRMTDMYVHAREMEENHGPQRDPRLLMQHADYAKYGPVAILEFATTEYLSLKKSKDWPAVTPSKPEANFTPHQPSSAPPSSGGNDDGNTKSPESKERKPKTDDWNKEDTSWRWKITPTDEDTTVNIGGVNWYYCAKCVVRSSGKPGIFNRTHTTSNHVAGKGKNKKRTPSAPEGNHTPIGDDSRSEADPDSTTPEETETSDEAKETDDLDGLEFDDHQVYLAPNNEIWVTEIDANGVDDNEVHVTTASLVGDLNDDYNELFYDYVNDSETLGADDCVSGKAKSELDLYFYDCIDFPDTTSTTDTTFDNTSIDDDIFYDCQFDEATAHTSTSFSRHLIWYLLYVPCIFINTTASVWKVIVHSIQQFHYFIIFNNFLASIFFWDLISYYISTWGDDGNNCLTRKHRRYKQKLKFVPLESFSHSWMILSAYQLSSTWSAHPWYWLSIVITSCINKVYHLEAMLELNCITLLQYHWIKGSFLWHRFHSPSPPQTLVTQDTLHFFDAVDKESSYPTAESFYDCNFTYTWESSNTLFDLLSSHAYFISPSDQQPPVPLEEQLFFFDCLEALPSDQPSSDSFLQSLGGNSDRIHLSALESSVRLPLTSNASSILHSSFGGTIRRLLCVLSLLLPVGLYGHSSVPSSGYDPFKIHELVSQNELSTSPLPVKHIFIPAPSTSDSFASAELQCHNVAAIMGNLDFRALGSPGTPFPIIFDSGASLTITPHKEDFIGPIQPTSKKLGGIASKYSIEGVGTVRWCFKSDKQLLVITTTCHYVPGIKTRLLSPQRIFNAQAGVSGNYSLFESHSTLTIDKVGSIRIPYHESTHLPTAMAKNYDPSAVNCPQINLAVLDEQNQNLSPSQKLHWHNRFGHRNLPAVQRIFRSAPFLSSIFKGPSRLTDLPKCAICEVAKAHRKPTKGHTHKRNSNNDGALKVDCLKAGAKISVDHFESRLKGRTVESRGGASADQFVGGCIFVDHMSGFIHVEHQLGFSSSETIRAKQNFEQLALNHGVLVESYLADNGIFKANAFVSHIREHNQKVNYCGVNAHHQNAVAERNIRTVSESARSMLLHASTCWKDGLSADLWPLAVSYACHLHNTLPTSNGTCPFDLFTGVTVPRHKLKDLHTWGCPVFVLDPALQQGKKLPRWEPRARQGIFVGFSRLHSSDVPLILNPITKSITPQYHVIFDDEFSTVPSIAASEEPPPFWKELELDENFRSSHEFAVEIDADSGVALSTEWMSPAELEEHDRRQARLAAIRPTFQYKEPLYPGGATTSTPQPGGATTSTPQPAPTGVPKPSPTATPTSTTPSTSAPTPSSSSPPSTLPASSPSTPVVPPSPAQQPQLRRSNRASKGQFTSTRYIDECYHLNNVVYAHPTYTDSILAYQADLHTDLHTGEVNCNDPRLYVAKTKGSDPDYPSFAEATQGEHSKEYIEAMMKEIKQLIKQSTWESVLRKDVPPTPDGKRRTILPSTWAFRLKRLPDGTPLKFKARFCVRGDRQTTGVDYFETYAPVVQWSTVRLLLTLILSNNWVTKQVDYTNAFAQAELEEQVYIEPPRGFRWSEGENKVLRLIKSLYGLKQAPRTFFLKLKDGLLERGFKQSQVDPCLFFKQDMIVVVYVDDTIIAGPNAQEIEDLITQLGVCSDEQRHTFELRDEGEVGDFLGIRIERHKTNFELTQTGLINKVLEESKMEDCNPAKTPCATDALGKDEDGKPFSETWEYSVVVGMLMYLATNSRPDIAFAVNQCARFTHCPKDSHATAVKRILRYLKGTKDRGMFISPSKKLQVDCHVDADFAGLYKVENDQDPVSVKSRTGYVLFFMGCPLTWLSKLQTQVALSTMEAEYIALSTAMRELIPVREIIKEIYTHVLNDTDKLQEVSYNAVSRTFGEIPQSIVHEDNEACLKFANLPKMSPRTKHIAIPYHFFRSKVEELEVKVIAIDTNNQLADQFTKGLPHPKFIRDREKLMGW